MPRESHITWENLEYLFKQDDQLSFFESLVAAAKRTAQICGCRGACQQNVNRLEGKLEDQQAEYNLSFGYIFRRFFNNVKDDPTDGGRINPYVSPED